MNASRNGFSLAVIGLVALAALAAPAGAVNIETILVAHTGNVNDPVTGTGHVAEAYRIGKYEVTNAQYIEFLTAVATVSDPHRLWVDGMNGYQTNGGIRRSGEPGNYIYEPRNGEPAWLTKPVVYTDFWDACRFANWLHNGRPSGQQGPGTTEDGAYNLNGVTSPDNGAVSRQVGAKFWVPSENQWYKAAYYQPGHGYFEYATGSDTVPTAEAPPGTDMVNGSASGGVGLTDVGAYSAKPSASPLGTFDQSGNVEEWTETILWHINPRVRVVRGGHCGTGGFNLSRRSSSLWPPGQERDNRGFRIASLPDLVLMGDANLDGVTDDDDLSLLLAHWGQDLTGEPDGGWSKGELDGTAPINDDDLSLLLAGWTGGSGGQVPEPVTVSMLALGGVAVLRRRR